MSEDTETPTTPEDPFSDAVYEAQARLEYEEKYGALDESGDTEEASAAESATSEGDAEPEGEREEELEAKEEVRLEEKPTKRKKKKEHDFKDEILPPDSWTAEGKETFKALPKPAQKELRRLDEQFSTWRKGISNQLRQKEQALARELESIGHIKAALRPFSERWAAKGVTEHQGMLQLAAFNKAFEEDKHATLEKMAKAVGGTYTAPNGHAKNNVAQSPQIDYASVESIVDRKLTQAHQQVTVSNQRDAIARQVDQTLYALKNEVTDDGKYCFPDLHNDAHLAEMQPILVAIKRKNPGLDWREAMLRAYRATDGKFVPKRTSNGTTNGHSRTSIARKAASSIRGGGSVPNGVDLEYIPGESVEDGMRRAWEAVHGPIR